MDYRTEAPEILREFLTYHEAILGHSRKTVDEYYLDLRNFFRFIKVTHGLVPRNTDLSDVSIEDLDINLVKSVTLSDVYDYLNFLSRDRQINKDPNNPEFGMEATSRARKVSAIRSFYKYLTNKAKLLTINPVQDLDAPKIRKSLPKYLTYDESINLLESVDGKNKERDYCILTLFLNCGVRISELVNFNLSDIHGDQIRVLGKGNKERILYLNDACQAALKDWLEVRSHMALIDKNALFVTSRHTRMTKSAVHKMIKTRLQEAGIDSSQYSAHKLRHTAATLMLKNGVDVRTLQEILGHENLNTTQIYTHVDNTDLKVAAMANPLSKVKKNTKKKENDNNRQNH